jgi:hypothetical protein
MKTFLIAVGAVALATPAMAQMSSPTPSTPPASSAPSTSTPPADSSATTTAPAAAPSDPKTIIASEFPTYDKDGSGSLSRGEFDTWLTALKEKSGGTPMKPDEKTSWLKGAFTTADKDKDKAVSLAELTDYLTAQG